MGGTGEQHICALYICSYVYVAARRFTIYILQTRCVCIYIYIYVIISQAHTSAITGLCALKKNPTTDEIHKTKNRSNINSKVLCGIARPRRRWKNREEDETPWTRIHHTQHTHYIRLAADETRDPASVVVLVWMVLIIEISAADAEPLRLAHTASSLYTTYIIHTFFNIIISITHIHETIFGPHDLGASSRVSSSCCSKPKPYVCAYSRYVVYASRICSRCLTLRRRTTT